MVQRGFVAGLLLAWAHAGGAAVPVLEVRVLDARGAPVDDAVVSLHAAEAGGDAPAALASPTADAVMEQVRGEFIPRTLVVATGTAVRFPNLDRIRHHVYSFSPAKVFELPLYSGEAHDPVVFDAPGVVAVGCNIHDWMLAHVVVLDTPVFTLSDASGEARLEASQGAWQLRVWHPWISDGLPPPRREVTLEDGTTRVDVMLELSPPVPRGRPGIEAGGRLP